MESLLTINAAKPGLNSIIINNKLCLLPFVVLNRGHRFFFCSPRIRRHASFCVIIFFWTRQSFAKGLCQKRLGWDGQGRFLFKCRIYNRILVIVMVKCAVDEEKTTCVICFSDITDAVSHLPLRVNPRDASTASATSACRAGSK